MIGSNKLTTNRTQLVTGNALAIVSAYGLTTLHHIYGALWTMRLTGSVSR
jgi:hypothetical protein